MNTGKPVFMGFFFVLNCIIFSDCRIFCALVNDFRSRIRSRDSILAPAQISLMFLFHKYFFTHWVISY